MREKKDLMTEDILGKEEFEFMQEFRIKQHLDMLGRFKVHDKTVFYSKLSLYLMDETSDVRKAIVWITEWK
jgi:hypothetical protein